MRRRSCHSSTSTATPSSFDLKRAICFAARLRRKADETDPTLSVEAVTERSKNKPPIDNPRRRT
jgi:hypothetical protein